MSHSVTITRTTTSTTNTSYIVLNTGYLKTVPGLLKLFELILGAVCVGILSYFYDTAYYNARYLFASELFYFLIVTTFMIGTFCILLSCVCSLSTGGIISKTLYELIYHAVACILIVIASVYLLIQTTDKKFGRDKRYDSYMAASIIGIVNAILYCVSTVYAHRSYRGI